jgi:hypothetical protein
MTRSQISDLHTWGSGSTGSTNQAGGMLVRTPRLANVLKEQLQGFLMAGNSTRVGECVVGHPQRFLTGRTVPGSEGYLPTLGRQHRQITLETRVSKLSSVRYEHMQRIIAGLTRCVLRVERGGEGGGARSAGGCARYHRHVRREGEGVGRHARCAGEQSLTLVHLSIQHKLSFVAEATATVNVSSTGHSHRPLLS